MGEYRSTDFVCSATDTEAYFVYDDEKKIMWVEARDEEMSKDIRKWFNKGLGKKGFNTGMGMICVPCPSLEEAKKIAERYKCEF